MKYKSYLSNCKRNICQIGAVLFEKLAKTVLWIPQSARIKLHTSRPKNIKKIAWKLPKTFLWGNFPSKMPVKRQYKFLTRLLVAVRVIC